jgi:hypothetical protein
MELANILRFVGIRHRVKQTAACEARPTQLAVLDASTLEVRLIDLADEDAELDFAFGILPVKYRAVEANEDLTQFNPRHVQYKALKKGKEVPTGTPEHHIRKVDGITQIASKVPEAYDGLKSGDAVAMVLGGSGNYLAYVLSRRGEEIGASIHRIPGYELKKARGGESDDRSKDGDATLLAEPLASKPELFHEVTAQDRAMITVTRQFMLRMDAMKAKVACQQRLRQRSIGVAFCSPEGIYPEGGVTKQFEELIANDVIYAALSKEEKRLVREMESGLEQIPLYTQVLSTVTGVGPAIAARLVVSIGDIRRFATRHKLKKFCGVHVLSDGTFARRRVGVLCNWNTEARQALYLVGDQFNRRPGSYWGQKLIENKRRYREKHPVPVEFSKGEGKKSVMRYTDGHIHKMAIWRTLSQFVCWLFSQGRRLDSGMPLLLHPDPGIQSAPVIQMQAPGAVRDVPTESAA